MTNIHMYFNFVDKLQISCAVHMLNNGGSIIESRQSQEKFLGIKVSITIQDISFNNYFTNVYK